MNRAIWSSIGFGILVQIAALALIRSFGPERVIAGWGAGALLRVVMLLVYGWAVVPAFGLPLAPALLSLAAVLFVTTLVEPLFLTAGRAGRGPTI